MTSQTPPTSQGSQQQSMHIQSAASQALSAVLSHAGMSLEQKIDTFKKLRQDNKINEGAFQSILKALARMHPPSQKAAETDTTKQPPTQSNPITAVKRKSPGDDGTSPVLSSDPSPPTGYANNINSSRAEPQPWPNAQGQRPTLSGGLASGLITGTPPVLARGQEDITVLLSGDLRHGPKKSPGAEQAMRRTIQDLVSSIDPNVKIVPEVEDLLLEIADEFIDSVANFSCRLAKHRGGDTLETRDLQLHLERNHNIRIPGFASDETRLSISQSAILPQTAGAPAAKKTAQGTHMTLRSARLNAVSQAKRDNKLM